MVGFTGRGGKNSKAVREFKASGNKAMQAGAFQKAMRLYTKALELDPGNAILYSNRSASHFNVRQFAESLEDAESAVLCDSMWWKAYKRKGLALIHMQRYEEAIQALEEGLQIVGKNAEMEKNLEFAKACQEQAQNLYILPEPNMMQRLESVPVFIVTDNVGQPFFVTYDDGQQVCTFYFDQEDAKATLDWIKSENPDLGDTARVIHITLNQAFNLAQETQKQYYEETTRAAAEEDRAAAAKAAERAKKAKEDAKKIEAKPVMDIDWDEEDKNEDDDDDDDVKKEEDVKEEIVKEEDVKEEDVKEEEEVKEEVKEEEAVKEEVKEDEEEVVEEVDATEPKGEEEIVKEVDATEPKGEEEVVEEVDATVAQDAVETNEKEGSTEKSDAGAAKKAEEAAADENAPLSFQFRPELRQVQVAVELLNKHPNPPVRPILRDPPSVRKARAEAAKAEKDVTEGEKADEKEAVEETEAVVEAKEGTEAAEKEEEAAEVVESVEKEGDTTGAAEESLDEGLEKSEDVELTVDNFNGIPIFQAKGLTLLQKNKQLIPLFFSKWDLEAAWKQLKESQTIEVPGECEIDVGTLEDVLRRMSESKTDEFESVFFVPSRESMKAINVKFPLDELAPPKSANGKNLVKKAGFSKAKQIAARGGTKDEIRAAIKEDLEKHVERQKMAEIIAQIEQARRTGGVGGFGKGGDGGGGGIKA